MLVGAQGPKDEWAAEYKAKKPGLVNAASSSMHPDRYAALKSPQADSAQCHFSAEAGQHTPGRESPSRHGHHSSRISGLPGVLRLAGRCQGGAPAGQTPQSELNPLWPG
jgi:hypothetical protein